MPSCRPSCCCCKHKPEEGVNPLPMPPKKRLKCGFCNFSPATPKGLQTHMGIMHPTVMHPADRGDSLTQWRGEPAPPAPLPLPPIADLDEGLPDLVADEDEDGAAAEAEDVPAGEEAVDQAREYARRLLREPSWVKWAEDTLHWCEANLLEDVGALFPAAEDFPTPETYRYLRLFHEHPGAAFASELLKANNEEPLDLSKVGMRCTFVAFAAGSWSHISVI